MSISQPPQGSLILLNGFPGTGKLSIARALKSKLQDTAETRLIDSHLIIDPVDAVYPGRGPERKGLRERLRRVMLDELKWLPDPEAAMIITTLCPGDNVEDAAVFAEHVDCSKMFVVWAALIVTVLEEYVSGEVRLICDFNGQIARYRGIPCYAFTISCGSSEHVLRLQSPGRVFGGKGKLIDPAVLETMVLNYKILNPTECYMNHDPGDGIQLHHSLIDTTKLSVEESARRILDIIAREGLETQRISGRSAGAY